MPSLPTLSCTEKHQLNPTNNLVANTWPIGLQATFRKRFIYFTRNIKISLDLGYLTAIIIYKNI